MPKKVLKLSILGEEYGICRLEPDSNLPGWAVGGDFVSLTRTREELSIVCPCSSIPQGVRSEAGWRALKVEGPLDFSLTGILSSISTVLANAGISIFAVSTFDTDYILVKGSDLDAAVLALRKESFALG